MQRSGALSQHCCSLKLEMTLDDNNVSLNNKLREFFSADRWQQSIDRFPLSGLELANAVNALKPNVVVDVGCGFNPFKGRIKNLVGFDFANRFADIVCDIEGAPFATNSVDVALALGSINFGQRVDIVRSLAVVTGWLRSNGKLFMRANPGEPIGWDIPVFPWSEDLAVAIGDELGLSIDGRVPEENVVLRNGVPAKRLFWIYVK